MNQTKLIQNLQDNINYGDETFDWAEAQLTDDEKLVRSLIMGNVLAHEVKTPEILITGMELAAGNTAVICAGPNVGKTWILLDLAHRIATGTPFFWEEQAAQLPGFDPEIHTGGARAPKHVLHIDFESGLDEIHAKLDRMNNYVLNNYPQLDGYGTATELTNTYYHYVQPGNFPKYVKADRENFSKRLSAFINFKFDSFDKKSKETARIVFIDHLSALNGGGDENSNGDMAQLVNDIRSVALRLKCTIIVLHHTTKASSKPGAQIDMNAIRGASSIAACFTSGWFIAKEDDCYRAHIIKKGYYSPVSDLTFRMADIFSDSKAYEKKFRNKSFQLGLKSATALIPKEQKLSKTDVLLSLASGPMNTSELTKSLSEKQIKFDKNKIKPMLEEMVAAEELVSKPGPKNSTIWALPSNEWVTE